MNFQVVAETDRAHLHNWSDISELNYWARRIGFQKLDENYTLVESRILKLRRYVNNLISKVIAA